MGSAAGVGGAVGVWDEGRSLFGFFLWPSGILLPPLAALSCEVFCFLGGFGTLG